MKRLLIPLFFMALAALACDAPVYDLPRILGIQADAAIAGKVYTLVGNSEAQTRYVSEDYGRTWQPTSEVFETSTGGGYSMQGDTLYYQGSPIWSFPRPTFRMFFLNDEDREFFALPIWERVTTSEAHGVLYVGMGTEGVLIFTAPGEWHLSAVGIAQLDPIPLTITDPPTLAVIIALALLVPPLGLLHAYVLSRVWVYALPGRKAWRFALKVTTLITLLAVIAIIVWLTDARTEYYPVVAVMTVVTVVLSVGAALLSVPEDQARRIAWRTALVAVIVPAGVAAVWWGWLLIIPMITGYAVYRWTYNRELRDNDTVSNSLLDRLALTSLLASVGGGIVIAILLFGLGSIGRWRDLFIIICWGVLVYFTIRLLISTIEKIVAERNLQTRSLRRTISLATILCYVLAPILAGAVFSGQVFAYGWFTSLLVP